MSVVPGLVWWWGSVLCTRVAGELVVVVLLLAIAV